MKAGNDADVVFIPTRRQAAKPLMTLSDDEATDLKVYSTGTAAKVTFAKDKELLYSSIDPGGDPTNPETTRKQNRKLLLTMRARDYTAEETSNTLQQEDLQEWLDNLQLKMHEARHSASSGIQTNPPERRSTVINIPDQDDSQNKSETGQKRRSRSTTSIAAANLDSGAALTDSNYLDKLQKSLQQASITSLQDRLVERQLKEEKQLAYAPLSVSVRPKVLDKNVSSSSSTKTRVKKTSKSSMPSDGRESVSSQSSQGSSDNSSNSTSTATSAKVPVKKSTPALRQRATVPKLFDQSQQKVDDLYRAAEQLILPPARRDPVTDGRRSRPQSPLFEPLADDVQLVDYWDTKETA